MDPGSRGEWERHTTERGRNDNMVKWHCIDDHEVAEVILVLVVVTIPTHQIKWRVTPQDSGGWGLSVLCFFPISSILGLSKRIGLPGLISQRVVGRAKWPEGPTDNPWRCSYQWQPAEEKDKGSQWWYRCSYVVRTSPVFLASGEQFCLSEVWIVLTLIHCWLDMSISHDL